MPVAEKQKGHRKTLPKQIDCYCSYTIFDVFLNTNLKWHIIYYETADAQCPIQDFIDARRARDQAKILSWIALLEEHGPNLPRPYADLLEGGIHELRIKLSGDQVRVLYFFCFRTFVILTHAFIKHTDRVPRSQIRQVQKMREDFLNRFDEQRLKEDLDEDL